MPIAADVMRVAELDRLVDEHVLVRVVSGQVDQGDDAAEDGDESDDGQDAQSGVDVGVAMKDLTHRVEARAAFSKSLLETGAFAEATRSSARWFVRSPRAPALIM